MPVQLKTQPNEARCSSTFVRHILPFEDMCPYSHNPAGGSKLEISYQPGEHLLEVIALRDYIDSFKGGRGDVRSMEGMIQQVAHDCAQCIKTEVNVQASLLIHPRQEMCVVCWATPEPAARPAQ